MAGEHRAAVDDAYLVRVGEHRQHAANVRMRYRVVVQIEADIGRLADADETAASFGVSAPCEHFQVCF